MAASIEIRELDRLPGSGPTRGREWYVGTAELCLYMGHSFADAVGVFERHTGRVLVPDERRTLTEGRICDRWLS